MEKLTEWVLLSLCALPFVGIGFVAGALHMRANYLSLLRRAQIDLNRLLRYSDKRATQERYIGYAVGYREGMRK